MKQNRFIKFHEPFVTGQEISNVKKAIKENAFAGDGIYTKSVEEKLVSITETNKCLLTPSGTAALEMAALSLNLKYDDEVIISSFTFVSTASAFALRGCKIKFVDIEKNTLQFNFQKIKEITSRKTKAIVVVHYGGSFSHQLLKLVKFCKDRQIFLIEDAAQSIGIKYKNQHLGTFGDLGCLSFHSTKNVHCGEGGALLINNENFIHQCEMIRQKGTNRSDFDKKLVNKYIWKTLGSSYLLADYNAAFLKPQLEKIEEVNSKRILIWKQYSQEIRNNNYFTKQTIGHTKYLGNGHIFFLVFRNKKFLDKFIKFMMINNIQVFTHYTELHNKKNVYKNIIKTNCTECEIANELCVRLPIHNNLTKVDIEYIIKKVGEFSL